MEPALSVVLACDGAVERIPERLEALARACAGLSTEVFIVHASDTVMVLPSDAPLPTTLVAAPSSLVPVLWGRGIAAARGRIVALTTTQFRVREGWAHALVSEFDEADIVGVGGSMTLAADAGVITRAVFLIRYSEHMASSALQAPRDLAGDNAAYLREAVMRVCPAVIEGFWEVDAHRLMRAEGGRFAHAPKAVAEFAPELSFREMLVNRFVHGSHFGAYRVSALRWPRWRAVAVAPLVPAVLFWRILGRVRRAGGSVSTAVGALPAMVPLLAAWAAGEAYGAAGGGARDAR